MVLYDSDQPLQCVISVAFLLIDWNCVLCSNSCDVELVLQVFDTVDTESELINAQTRQRIDNENELHTLCDACGLLNDCRCNLGGPKGHVDDHNYAAGTVFDGRTSHPPSECVRQTVRQHKRTGVPLTRKRSRNVSAWKCVKRKKLRQSGEAYCMSTGKMAPAKVVKPCKRDHESCRFKCAENFDYLSQQDIHKEHWSLDDDQKRQFYLNTTTRCNKARTRGPMTLIMRK